MKKYRHLSRNERDDIAVLVNRGHSIRTVAFFIGRSPSSVSRELRRNKGKKKYRPSDAQFVAHHRRHQDHRPAKRLKTDISLQKRVTRQLKEGWSPEIIAGRLKRENDGVPVISHEAIYQWVYSEAKPLIKCLVQSRPRRRSRSARPWPKRSIPQRVSIHQRPESVDLRQEPGHWETDLVVGPGRAALQVLVERQTRFTRLRKVPNKTAQASYEALSVLFSTVHLFLRKSITYDNGFENLLHVELNQRFQLKSFFCEPYHSWEKGTVENTNGLVRRFFPKRTNFDTLPPRVIERVEAWLNRRPRKCLNFQTSAEAYQLLGVALTP